MGTGHYDVNDFDLVKIKNGTSQLADLQAKIGRIEKQWWPPEITELNPDSVTKTENGIYIELDSFFVEKSGLFIPASGINIDPGAHQDPSYKLLDQGIYSYHATG